MAKYTKRELAELAKLNESDVGDLVRRHAKTYWRWQKRAAAYEQAMIRARDEFAKEADPSPEALKLECEDIQKQIVGWLMVNRPADGKPKHIDFTHGRVGIRENPVAVKRSKGVSDEMIIVSLRDMANTQKQVALLDLCDAKISFLRSTFFYPTLRDGLMAQAEEAMKAGLPAPDCDDAAVLSAFEALPDFSRYLRVETTLNKEALREDQHDIEAIVARVGVDFVQDETFYVEPKAESEIHEI